MKIGDMNFTPITIPANKSKGQQQNAVEDFGKMLQKQLQQVSDLQVQADKITESFLAGDVQDLHQVMAATEKANLALQLTVEIRNKLVEAYQEIYRMQI